MDDALHRHEDLNAPFPRHPHRRPDRERQVGASQRRRAADRRCRGECGFHAGLSRAPDPHGAAVAEDEAAVPHRLYATCRRGRGIRWRAGWRRSPACLRNWGGPPPCRGRRRDGPLLHRAHGRALRRPAGAADLRAALRARAATLPAGGTPRRTLASRPRHGRASRRVRWPACSQGARGGAGDGPVAGRLSGRARAAARPEAADRIVIAPDRDLLRARIAARFAAMVASGGLDEARDFAALGLDPALPAMKAIGVPEMMAAAIGARPRRGGRGGRHGDAGNMPSGRRLVSQPVSRVAAGVGAGRSVCYGRTPV